MKCIICSKKILPDPDGWDGGHNAEPVANGRCCGVCNAVIVIQARLIEFQIRRKE